MAAEETYNPISYSNQLKINKDLHNDCKELPQTQGL